MVPFWNLEDNKIIMDHFLRCLGFMIRCINRGFYMSGTGRIPPPPPSLKGLSCVVNHPKRLIQKKMYINMTRLPGYFGDKNSDKEGLGFTLDFYDGLFKRNVAR